MRHRLILDRFEGEFAVLTDENKKTTIVRKSCLPQHVSEGSTLYLENGVYETDEEDETGRRQRIEEKINRLFE